MTNARPVLSIVIPTVGRPTLERTVRSLLRQEHALAWEAILVGDTHGEKWAADLPRAVGVAQTDSRLRYVSHDGGRHAVGHPQRNFGPSVARGRYVAFLGDDDIYLPGALAAIGGAISARPADAPRVFLFRWIAPWKQVLWHTAGYLGDPADAPGAGSGGFVDAEMIVCPNVPDRLGTWTNRYAGDYDFIRDTIERWGGLARVVWQPEIIAQAQPDDAEDWTRGGVSLPPVEADVVRATVYLPVPRPVQEAAA